MVVAVVVVGSGGSGTCVEGAGLGEHRPGKAPGPTE
jgi:hypothetical protein